MTCMGLVKNGVVLIDEGMSLPEGTRVEIKPVEPATLLSLAERLAGVRGVAKGLPSDLAENHDHYLHGRPKKSP